MEQIELKTKPLIWVYFFIFLFVLSSIPLIYFFNINDLALILGVVFVAIAIITIVLSSIFNLYNQKVVLSDTEISVFGVPSATISYNEIQKIRVSIGGFKIYGKSQTPILISNMSSNFSKARELLIRKISTKQDVKLEGSKRLIRKYFTEYNIKNAR